MPAAAVYITALCIYHARAHGYFTWKQSERCDLLLLPATHTKVSTFCSLPYTLYIPIPANLVRPFILLSTGGQLSVS